MWINSHNPHANQAAFTVDNGTTSFSVSLSLRGHFQVYESDSVWIVLAGRIRPYGKDYPAQHDLAWLAQLWCNSPDATAFSQRIAGFFSMIVFDNKHNNWHVVTDHVGSVPVYIGHQGNQVWVTDHLKHSWLRKYELDPQAIYDYFFFHSIPSNRTIYKNVIKTGPGMHLLFVDNRLVELLNIYRPDYRYHTTSAEQLQQQCRQLIQSAVSRNVSPDCAAFLSGGLDSSTVSGLLSVQQPSTRTFSIGFDAKGYDETEYALITAKHFNTNHHVHYLQPEEIVENFVEVAAHFDEPFGNSSAMAAYICASVAKQHGVNVMLAGDGGDEIFAGNERYAKQKVFELFADLPKALQSLLDTVTHSPLGGLPLLRKARSYVDQAKIPLPDRLDTYNFLNRFAPEQMFCETFLAQVDTQAPAQAKRERYHQSKATDPVDKMMYLDWKFTLADNDLVKVSSMCQKAGVAVRYPLFEKEVVDFSCTVPADIKLPGNKLRDFYKNSFKGFLADETLNKAKHGFGLPFGVWMKEQPRLQQLTEQTLAALKNRQIIRPEFIDEALQIYRSGHLGYYGELIWIMVVLELWLQGRERNGDAT